MSKPSKELLQEWNARLRESGFRDIERSDGSLIDDIRTNDPRHPNSYNKQVFDSHRRYYEVAGYIVTLDASSGSLRAPTLAMYQQIKTVEHMTQQQIRVLHAQGARKTEIAAATGVSVYLIGRIIRLFRQQINEEILYDQETEAS